jgi:hypothetical protein
MRDTAVQRVSTMIPIGALQQPPEPHVSHAESGAFIKSANPQSGMEKPERFRVKWIAVHVKKTRQKQKARARL